MFLYNKDSVTASGEGMKKSHSSLVSTFCGKNFSVVLGSSSPSNLPRMIDSICIHFSGEGRLFPGCHLLYTSKSFHGQSPDTGHRSKQIYKVPTERQRVTDRPSVQQTQANMTGLHCDQAGLANSAKVRFQSPKLLPKDLCITWTVPSQMSFPSPHIGPGQRSKPRPSARAALRRNISQDRKTSISSF